MTITAKEVLRLEKEEVRYETSDHDDPFVDATANYAIVLEGGKYVDMGETRPSGVAVIPGTLRGRATDWPPVYGNTFARRAPMI